MQVCAALYAATDNPPLLCLAAAVFRESCEELAQQAAVISAQVSQLEGVTLDAVSLEVRPCEGVMRLSSHADRVWMRLVTVLSSARHRKRACKFIANTAYLLL